MAQHSQHGSSISDVSTKNHKGLIVALVVVIAIIAAAAIAFFALMGGQDGAITGAQDDMAVSEQEYAGSHVDWDVWQERNDNVYAWIEVPGTDIDLPILQHPLVDDYYLVRTIDGEAEISGALYTQKQWNSKDLLADELTVIYGHTFQNTHELAGTMFSQLHEFEDPTFFDEHPNFTIYTPEHELTYEIVSAFEYDNRHLFETNEGFQDPAKLQAFFDMVQDPDSINKNVREVEPLVAGEDHVVVLSTCTMPSQATSRYLVVGVLTDVQDVSS